MAKYAFSHAQRYAVFTTHGDKCYICSAPIDMSSFQIDHIIPESLLANPPGLAVALDALGRNGDFDVNSYENWLPACSSCNNVKRATIWAPSLLVQLALQRAESRAAEARSSEAATLTKRKVGAALTTLHREHEKGVLTAEVKLQLRPLVEDYAAHHPADADVSVMRLTPTYAAPLYEVLKDDGGIRVVRGPYGVGAGPSSRDHEVASEMCCGVCALPYFNGVRCVICGNVDGG